MDVEGFWRDYAGELQARVERDHGTGAGYDWSELGTTREEIPARVASTVEKMRAAMKQYAPSFESNAAMKTVAKRYGFTSAGKLRSALLGASQ